MLFQTGTLLFTGESSLVAIACVLPTSPTLATPFLSNINCPSFVPSYNFALNPVYSPEDNPTVAPSLVIISFFVVYSFSACVSYAVPCCTIFPLM